MHAGSLRAFRTASNFPSISSMPFRATSASWDAALLFRWDRV